MSRAFLPALAVAAALLLTNDTAGAQGTGSITGRVTRAATGQAIAGVRVDLSTPNGGGASVVTGVDGRYVSPPLAPGLYYAHTWNFAGFVDELYYEYQCVDFCSPQAGTPILVTSGGTTANVDFTLQAVPRIEGGIFEPVTGTRLPGLRVTVRDRIQNFVNSTTTDADGNYWLTVPAEGQYSVQVDAWDQGYVSEAYDDVPCAPACDLSRATLVMARPDQVTRAIDFALGVAGTVTGRVVDAAGTVPLAGAQVRVIDAYGATARSAVTDADGRYRAEGLLAGTYRVRAGAGDYVAEAFDAVPCTNFECAFSAGRAISVALAATTSGIDFALTAAGHIEGTVTDALTHLPIPDVDIEVVHANGQPAGRASTDATGRYQVGGLSSGSYLLRTRNTAAYLDRLFDGLPCTGDACLVTSGTPVFVIAPATAPGIDFALTTGGRVSGVVTAQDTGLPVRGVPVSLFDVRGGGASSTSTDDSGHYGFTGLPSGTYFVRAGSEGTYMGEVFDDVRCPWQDCAPTGGTPLSVTAGQVTPNVDLMLQRGGRITGTITDAATGAPLRGVNVELRAAVSSSFWTASTISGDSGEYELPGLEAGTYYVRALTTGDGHSGEVFDDQPCEQWPCGTATATTVDVAVSATTSGIDFALLPPGTITGTVTDASTGVPLAGVFVSALDASGNTRQTASTGDPGRYEFTGMLPGTYTVRADGNSRGYLGALYAGVPCIGTTCEGPGTPVGVASGQATSGIDMGLRPAGRIAGTVTDAVTGLGVPGVAVVVLTTGGSQVAEANTTTSGAYSVIGVPPGSYYVRARLWQRYVDQVYQGVACAAGCPLTFGTPIVAGVGTLAAPIDFQLTPTATVAGHVTDGRTGQPVAGASVRLADASERQLASGSTDRNGAYAVEGLFPGLYYVRVHGPDGYASVLVPDVPCPDAVCSSLGGTPVAATAGSTRQLDVSLLPVGTITGRVRADESGAPLASVWVFAYDSMSRAAGGGITDAYGQYAIPNLPVGEYHLATAALSDYLDEVYDDVACGAACDPSAGRAVVLPSYGATGVDFSLGRGGQIAGTATDLGTGRLLANVLVDVFDGANAHVASTTTTARGTYVTPGVPAGSYYVKASGATFVPQVFQRTNCAGGSCDARDGTPVTVLAAQATPSVDFPLQCATTTTPGQVAFHASGATQIVTVTAASPDCRWGVVADPGAPWLTADTAPHNGSGTVDLTAAANTGPARTAVLTVAGVPFEVTQAQGVSLTYYLAEGATGDFFDLDVAIANPNDAEAEVTARFLTSSGQAVTRTLTVGAMRRTTIRVDDIPGLESTPVSTEVTSNDGLPLVVERTMIWGEGEGGHAGTAVESPRTRWYFAEGFQGMFDTYLLVMNPGVVTTRCTFTFLLEHEAPVVVQRTVGAGERGTLWAGEVPALAGRAFGIVVDADRPIVAERAMYFGADGQWSGGHASAGVPAPATAWFLAEGATGTYFDTYLLVGNPNAHTVDVTFTFFLPDGRNVTAQRQVAASGRLTVNVEDVDPALANTGVSTRVFATDGVVVERAMYWPGTGWTDGHASPGLTQAATRWGLADGRIAGLMGFVTYILVANPGSEAAAIQVSLLHDDTPPTVRTYVVPPGSRFNVQLDPFSTPLEVQAPFGAVVESVNNVPIVVERAMYWSKGPSTWTGGTGVVAVPLPPR